MTPPIVTLLTDFGERDTFVGQMKGVLLSHCPDVALVDLTHQVSPQSVVEGALHLHAAWRSFPAGSVHLAVVDPGVGTSRRPLALEFEGHRFVLPDNGLISAVLQGVFPDAVAEIQVPDTSDAGISRTFHGRDVFAPAAGRLATGAALWEIGSEIDPSTLVRLELSEVRTTEFGVAGEIVLVDHFGNAITNIRASDLPGEPSGVAVGCGTFSVHRVSSTYQDVEPGEPVALVSSMGTLELAVRDGSAAERFGLETGATVIADA